MISRPLMFALLFMVVSCLLSLSACHQSMPDPGAVLSFKTPHTGHIYSKK